jgi:tripartite ATP-independent transporter DctP family solute receptor
MKRSTRRTFLAQSAVLAASMVSGSRAFAAEFSYKFANELPLNHPVNQYALKAADKIREETGGSIDIKVFPDSQLGSQTDMLHQVRSGAIEFVPVSAIILSTLVPVSSISGLGFIFPDSASVWKAMDGELGKHVKSNIEKADLVAFDRMWDTGYRQITSSTKPIATPDDLKGFKIRVPISPLWTSLFKALGASPVSINFGEVYTALQTKIVDGQETALSLVESNRFYEVQQFCSLTNHMWDGPWLVANKRAWERLPEKARTVVARHFNDAAVAERGESDSLNERAKGELTKRGMVFNVPNRPEFQAMLRKAGFYTDWKSKFGEDAWRILEKSVGNLA